MANIDKMWDAISLYKVFERILKHGPLGKIEINDTIWSFAGQTDLGAIINQLESFADYLERKYGIR